MLGLEATRSGGLNCLGPGDLHVEGPGLCFKAEESSEASPHLYTGTELGKGMYYSVRKSHLWVPGHCSMTP